MGLIRLAADGAPGAAGADGASWTGSAGTACPGRRGEDGRPGGRGADAGTLDLALALADGGIRIWGVSSTAGACGHRLALDAADTVLLSARGGDGGPGGDAGRGEDGGRGRDGGDANRFRRGEDGGPGGDGGDAGDPADGGDAGAGGTVRLALAEDDADLLAACAWDVGAGSPGRAGRSASGGRGGRGGDGGSGHSWQEPYQDTETYRDAQGNSRSRSVTRYRHHSNPGGHAGRSGADGRPSRRTAADGHPAAAGGIAICIRTADGSASTWPAAWDLELLAVELEPVDERLFPGDRFEPGQVLRISRLVVRNRGGMPTPRSRDLELHIEAGPGVEGLTPALLERGIAPGATSELRDTAGRVRLVDRRAPGEEPDDASATLAFRIIVPRLHRALETRLERGIALASPVVLERPQVYTALGPGACSAWTWRVVNRSLIAFGADAPRPDGLPPRPLATCAASPDGDAAPEALRVRRGDGELPWGDGLRDAIPLLPAGAGIDIAYRLAWREGVRPFSGRDLAVALEVGRRDDAAPQTVQRRCDRIKVAATYRRTPEAAVLLIANHGTTVAEVEAWRSFLASLGLEADVLDLSHEGAVDLDLHLSPTQSLREEWRGRTIIALNNRFAAPSGEQSCADYLHDRQVVNAIRDDGISWYAPGDGRPLFTAEGLLACRRRSRPLLRLAEVDAAAVAAMAPPAIGDLELDVVQVRHLGLPARSESLLRLAAGWSRRLAADHPRRRFLIIHRAAPRPLDGGWWTGRWRLGTLTLLELPAGDAGMAALPCPGDRLHDAAWIRSPGNRAALILALPFPEKLRLFTSLVVAACNFDLVPERRALAAAYADAILADLALEQEAIRRSAGSWAAWSLAGILVERRRVWCERWRLLCTTGFAAALPAGSERGRLLTQLIGRLHVLLGTMSPWWRFLVPGSRHHEITRQCRRLLRDLERTAFGTGKPLFSLPDDPWTDAGRNLAEARRAIAAETARVRGLLRPGGAAADRFLSAACPAMTVEILGLRRLPDAFPTGIVAGETRDAALLAQDAEDELTAARAGIHRAARERLLSGADGGGIPGGAQALAGPVDDRHQDQDRQQDDGEAVPASVLLVPVQQQADAAGADVADDRR